MKNYLRTILCVLMAAMLAAFALPSIAAQPVKVYNLTMQSNASAPLIVTAALINVSPNGNSTISSFRLSVIGSTISSVGALPSGVATIDPTGTSVTIANMSPLKPGMPAFNVILTMGGCGDAITWTALVSSGSQLNAENFNPSPNPLPPGQLTTNVACGLFACNTNFIVPFTLPNGTSPPTTDPRYVAGQRGKYDKDGAVNGDGCVAVPVYVTNTLVTNNKLHFRWPLIVDELAAVSYTVNTTAAPQPGFPKVAWKNTDGTPADTSDPSKIPAYITVIPCVSGDLPTPYGTLAAPVLAGDTKIQVDTSTGVISPPATPFPIVIGTEYRSVIKTTGSNTWTLQTPIAAAHDTGGDVVSSPLPILPAGTLYPYVTGTPAQMCLAAQGTYPGTGGYYFKYIDIGDGWIGQN